MLPPQSSSSCGEQGLGVAPGLPGPQGHPPPSKSFYAAPRHRPYGNVGEGRTLPPQMKAAMRGRVLSSPESQERSVTTIPGDVSSLGCRSSTFPSRAMPMIRRSRCWAEPASGPTRRRQSSHQTIAGCMPVPWRMGKSMTGSDLCASRNVVERGGLCYGGDTVRVVSTRERSSQPWA